MDEKPWEPWATTLADEIRQLIPPEQRGPWREARCIMYNPLVTEGDLAFHDSEAPHFFYCKAQLANVRNRRGATKPWAARDQGLCIRCHEPAERTPVTMSAPVACVEAERRNTTVARLLTKRHCRGCNPGNPENLPLCRGRVCRETGQPRRTQPKGCCGITRNSRRRHCAECCAIAAANLSAQVMPIATRTAGAAARKKSGDERRERIRSLHRKGTDSRDIVDIMGVSLRACLQSF